MVEPVLIQADRPIAPWLLRAWELLAPRLPGWACRLIGRALLGLPRGSRVRRWFVLQFAAVTWNVSARTRLDLFLPIWDSACEWHWDATFAGLGFEEVYQGHEGVSRALLAWNEIWTERSFTVREVLDGGRTWVVRATVAGRGSASGVPAHIHVSSVARMDPLVVDWRNFNDDAEALREAGFDAVAEDTAAQGKEGRP